MHMYLASPNPSGRVHWFGYPGIEVANGGIFRLTRTYYLTHYWPWHLAVNRKSLLNGLLNINDSRFWLYRPYKQPKIRCEMLNII